MSQVTFEELKGQTILSITGIEKGDEETIITTEAYIYRLYHNQDCCESVSLEDIEGDIEDVIGRPIILAEESTNSDDPNVGKTQEQIDTDAADQYHYNPDSFTWTFYRLATEKGFIVIRWYGESNGYYSESVYIDRIKNNANPLAVWAS
ncbi:hypothetical protein S21ZY_046 [Pseudomonas phage ZY21]|nr:hypothetical protein S21ZY_046 [Pseudomonas phage ZY21]